MRNYIQAVMAEVYRVSLWWWNCSKIDCGNSCTHLCIYENPLNYNFKWVNCMVCIVCYINNLKWSVKQLIFCLYNKLFNILSIIQYITSHFLLCLYWDIYSPVMEEWKKAKHGSVLPLDILVPLERTWRNLCFNWHWGL